MKFLKLVLCIMGAMAAVVIGGFLVVVFVTSFFTMPLWVAQLIGLGIAIGAVITGLYVRKRLTSHWFGY